MEDEFWKNVSEINIPANKFGHTYSVSNHGRARNNMTGRMLKKQLKKHEYQVYDLAGKQYKIHRLVAKLFVHNPNPDKYDIVNHKDLNKTNNYYKNLEWCDQDYNIKHAAENGVFVGIQVGENNGMAMLTESDVLDIWINDRSADYIVQKFGMVKDSANQLRHKMRWKHLIPVYRSMVSEDHDIRIKEKRKKEDSNRKRKLSDEQFIEVYQRTQLGESNVKLAKEFNVGETVISNIRNLKDKYMKDVLINNGIKV